MAAADPTPPRLPECKECHCQTGGGEYCYEHKPYLVSPKADGSFHVDRYGRRRVWFDEPPHPTEELAAMRAEVEAARLALSKMQQDVDDALDGQFAGTEPCAARAVQQQREALDAMEEQRNAARLAQQVSDKQLMKWTALADEQEQRAIAAEVAQQEARDEIRHLKSTSREVEWQEKYRALEVAQQEAERRGFEWLEALAIWRQKFEAADSRLTEARQQQEKDKYSFENAIAGIETRDDQIIDLTEQLEAADARAEEVRTQADSHWEALVQTGKERTEYYEQLQQLKSEKNAAAWADQFHEPWVKEVNANTQLRTELAEATRTHQALVDELRFILASHVEGDIAINVKSLKRWYAALTADEAKGDA